MATKTVAADLPAEIFDVQVNVPLIHQVVVAQMAAARQGTHGRGSPSSASASSALSPGWTAETRGTGRRGGW